MRFLRRAGRAGRVVVVGATSLALTVHAPHQSFAAKTTKKTTKKAVKVPATKAPKPTIPLAKIALAPDKKTGFCQSATDAKAKFADLKSKKTQLGTSAPASLYKTEITVGNALEKAAPKELAPDFEVIENYVAMFASLAETKDADKLAAIANNMSSEAVLDRYFDATVRVEAFVRRTCGFPVGI